MTTIYTDPEKTKRKVYVGEAEASDEDKAEVGGEKTLSLSNILYQSDIDAQTKADSLLLRLKTKKEYVEISSEFCPIPIERRDSITVQERVTHEKDVDHLGIIRGIRLEITPNSQVLSLILEE